VFSTKQRRYSESLFLKIPPQADKLLMEEPSVLHFTQCMMNNTEEVIYSLKLILILQIHIDLSIKKLVFFNSPLIILLEMYNSFL